MSLGQKLSKVLISKSTSLLSNIVLISQLGSALMLVGLRGSTACSAFLALGWGKPGSAVDSDKGHSAAVGLGSLLASAPVAMLVLAVIEIPLVQVG